MRIITQLSELLILALVAFAGGLMKIMASKEQYSVGQYAATLFISVFVGVIAGGLSLEYGAGQYLSLTIVSIASLASQDIIKTIINNGDLVSQLIRRALENITDKFTK